VAKGRVQAEAEVYDYDIDAIYPLSDFVAAPMQATGNDPEVHSTFTPSANIQRLNSIDDLDKWDVTDRVKVIIVQGNDPDNPKEGDNSRSAWLFDALCQLARAEVPEEVMYSIITDPDMGIASSVLDKGNSVEKYALKQIRSAMEHAVDPDLHELNKKYACIMVGGQFRVMQEKYNSVLKRPEVLLLRKTDFTNAYQNRLKDLGEGKKMPLAQWWLAHEKRRQYTELIFLPNATVPGAFNMWKGFRYPAIPGDKHDSYLAHLHDNICQSNTEHYNYLIKWMARSVQKPDRPGEVAVVLRGGSGNGKSFFARHFGALFGPHFLQVGDSRHLTGNFNSHLEGTVLLFSDEAFFAGDPRHKSVLKVLITEETLAIERKGLDLHQTANFLHIIIASNDDHLVPSQAKERRFFVLDVGNERQQDSHYFAAIRKDLEDGGYESLLHFLMKCDLGKFNVRNVPNTNAQSEQKMLSMDPIDSWWMLCLEEGRIRKTDHDWHRFYKRADVLDSFRQYLQEWNIPRRPTPQGLGARLKKMLPMGYPNRGNRRKQEYEFPDLVTCRQSFEDHYGMNLEWPDEASYNQDSTEKSEEEPF
jgi:hypothetical protein